MLLPSTSSSFAPSVHLNYMYTIVHQCRYTYSLLPTSAPVYSRTAYALRNERKPPSALSLSLSLSLLMPLGLLLRPSNFENNFALFFFCFFLFFSAFFLLHIMLCSLVSLSLLQNDEVTRHRATLSDPFCSARRSFWTSGGSVAWALCSFSLAKMKMQRDRRHVV